MTLARLF